MLNYWWVTRPKRKLNSIPEVLSTFSELSLNEEWAEQRSTHLQLEDALEQAGLKIAGERRDRTGGGARTYKAWLVSLGLIFEQQSTKKIMLTLAGEAIMKGDPPVEVLTSQILKYQFPSSYSIGRGVKVSSRFKIRPFLFMLRLLSDSRIGFLSEEEIAKIICVEAEAESASCFEYIVKRILKHRDVGDRCLSSDFFEKYKPSRGDVNPAHPYSHLLDIANTMINWLDYTQFVYREKKKIMILPEKVKEVEMVINNAAGLIDRPEQHEYFQRKYGIDPKHRKDTRNLAKSATVTAQIIAEAQIKKVYISESLSTPTTKITNDLIEKISSKTGMKSSIVEQTLQKLYPYGSIGSFMTKYFEMAFNGRDEATEFELATVDIFEKVFGYEAKHVGPIGKTPDVLIVSDKCGYQAIIDNKAYSKYSISNDHHNRMVHNYIGDLKKYSKYPNPLAFFSYISGGFGANIDNQIQEIKKKTDISGSAVSVTNMITMIKNNQNANYSHDEIRKIFSADRQVVSGDL